MGSGIQIRNLTAATAVIVVAGALCGLLVPHGVSPAVTVAVGAAAWWLGERARGQKETELLRREQAMAEASDLKTRFLANVSHELKTPLTSVVAYGNLLAEGGELTDEQQRLVRKIVDNGNHLLYLINDLFDISRIEAGRLQLTMTRVALEECIEAAVVAVQPQAEAKGLRVEVDMPDAVLPVNGNFHRLQQVFTNLLGNAVKFTESGSVGIRASCTPTHIEVRVSDSGPGIPAEQRARIFDEFVQGDDSVRRRYGGSGLGLAICRRLVALHGGEITIEENVPKGTIFVVRLSRTP